MGCQIGRVRVGVNEKVKILLKLKKKSEGGCRDYPGGGGGDQVDVNEELKLL